MARRLHAVSIGLSVFESTLQTARSAAPYQIACHYRNFLSRKNLNPKESRSQKVQPWVLLQTFSDGHSLMMTLNFPRQQCNATRRVRSHNHHHLGLIKELCFGDLTRPGEAQ